MKHLQILCYLILALPINAQIQLGKVREINSDKRTLSDVQIIFKDAVPTTSNNDGNFRLAFSGKKAGDAIIYEEISKSGYELVNITEIQKLKISRTTDLGVDIIMAKKGVIAAAKKEYYEISDAALTNSFTREKKAIRNQLKQSKITQTQYQEQIKALRKQYEEQQKQLHKLSEKFARTNFDDVSELVKEALELFKAGDIEGAIKKLEDADLIERTNKRLEERERLNNAKNELQEQKLENEKGLIKDIDYALFEIKAIEKSKEREKYESNLRLFYNQLGEAYYLLEKGDSSIFYYQLYQKAEYQIFINDSLSDFIKNRYASSFKKLGDVYLKKEDIQKATEYFNQYKKLQKELVNTYPNNLTYIDNLAIIYFKIGDIYANTANLNSGKLLFEEAKQTYTDLLQKSPYKTEINQYLERINKYLRLFK